MIQSNNLFKKPAPCGISHWKSLLTKQLNKIQQYDGDASTEIGLVIANTVDLLRLGWTMFQDIPVAKQESESAKRECIGEEAASRLMEDLGIGPNTILGGAISTGLDLSPQDCAYALEVGGAGGGKVSSVRETLEENPEDLIDLMIARKLWWQKPDRHTTFSNHVKSMIGRACKEEGLSLPKKPTDLRYLQRLSELVGESSLRGNPWVQAKGNESSDMRFTLAVIQILPHFHPEKATRQKLSFLSHWDNVKGDGKNLSHLLSEVEKQLSQRTS
jgi:hypothetical protein